MQLTKKELEFLKSIENQAFTLTMNQSMKTENEDDMNTAEALEEKGLCNTSFSPSKGYSARITEEGKKLLENL